MEHPASWDLLTASIAVCDLEDPFAAWAFLVVQGLVRDATGDRETFVKVVHEERDRDITGPSVALRVASSLKDAEIALEGAKVPDPWAGIASERLEVMASWKTKQMVEAKTPRKRPWWTFKWLFKTGFPLLQLPVSFGT